MTLRNCLGLLLLFMSHLVLAETPPIEVYALPAEGEYQLSEDRYAVIHRGDKLKKIARRYRVPADLLSSANDLTPEAADHLVPGDQLLIPGVHLPQNIQREGIVIDRSQRLLFFFLPESNEVTVYPVAVGRDGYETPEGSAHIVAKLEHPDWHVPKSVHEYMLAHHQIDLPDVIQYGDKRYPLGTVVLRTGFANGSILIHGTNDPNSISRAASSGCIRMYTEHAEDLFQQVEVGTPITIV